MSDNRRIKFVEIILDTGTYVFFSSDSSVPLSTLNGYPTLKSLSQAANTVIPTGGLGNISQLSLTLSDFVENGKASTFMNRLRGGNPYYIDKIVNVYSGLLSDFSDIATNYNLNKQSYYLDTFDYPDESGNVRLTARDISKKLDDKRAIKPKAVTCTLGTTLAAGTTGTITINNSSDLSADEGYILIDNEIIRYENRNTGADTVSIASTSDRGILGNGVNVATAHDSGAKVTEVWTPLNSTDRSKTNCVDVIKQLLIDTGISTGNIDTALFNEERDTWLSTEDITGLVSKPTPIKKIIEQICEQCYIDIWFDVDTQLYKLRANRPQIVAFNATLTSDNDILDRGHVVRHDFKEQATQVWVYYDKIDYLGSDSPNNYSTTEIGIDATAESNYGASSQKIIYANFLDDGNAASAAQLTNRYLKSLKDGTKKVYLQLDLSRTNISLNDRVIIETEQHTDANGDPDVMVCQISKIDKTSGETIKVEAIKLYYDSSAKYASVGPSSLSDYGGESNANRIRYAFISNSSSKMKNGDDGYIIV